MIVLTQKTKFSIRHNFMLCIDYYITLCTDYYIQGRKKSRELREKTANLLNIVSLTGSCDLM